MRAKESKIFVLALSLFVILFATALIYYYIYRPNTVESFNFHISEYIADVDKSTESTNYSPYLRGKVITIDNENKAIDDIYFSLPNELKASEPNEVGTIILIERREVAVGRYTDGTGAYQDFWQLTIVDKTLLTIVGTIEISGEEPPEYKQSSGPKTGTSPKTKVIEYLSNLPCK
jgi:hypothetical protein